MEDKKLILERVEIIDAGSNGKAVGKVNNVVIFVPFAAPGDIVDVKIVMQKKNYFEGKIVAVHRYSENRVTPFCEHFGTCGGCHWQHLMYNDQLRYKRKQVIDNFIRIGKFIFPEVKPIIPSKDAIYYRNKLEFTFNNKRWLTTAEINQRDDTFNTNALGFYIPQRFDKILDINNCYLQKHPSNSIRLFIKKYALENNLEFYDVRKRKGFLRNIIIRNSTTGEFLLIVIFNYNDEEQINKMLEHISAVFPEITSLHYVINNGCNDTITNLEVKLFKGSPYMIEKMENLQFRVGPVSFYQTNSNQAYELYKVARDYAQLDGTQIVYDLYTGTGTIAQFVASKAKKVIGVEFNELAVKDAKINASINDIHNTEYFHGDMMKVLSEEFFITHGKPDVIITDPPRSGMHTKVIDQMMKAEPDRIVYVSCNPATQARDIALMIDKYEVTKVQPVDMFPQTHHVECVVLLERRNVQLSNDESENHLPDSQTFQGHLHEPNEMPEE